MHDLISRQAAIDAIEEYADRLQMVDWKENPGVPYKAYALNWCINTIRDLPSVEVEPVKHRRWRDYPIADGCLQCSICGVLRIGEPSNFCPNCGAKMDLKEEAETEYEP